MFTQWRSSLIPTNDLLQDKGSFFSCPSLLTSFMGSTDRLGCLPPDLIRWARWRADRINGHCRPKSVIPRNRTKSPTVRNHPLPLIAERPTKAKIIPTPSREYLTTVLLSIHVSPFGCRTARCAPIEGS